MSPKLQSVRPRRSPRNQKRTLPTLPSVNVRRRGMEMPIQHGDLNDELHHADRIRPRDSIASDNDQQRQF